jgi:hypothetical protein
MIVLLMTLVFGQAPCTDAEAVIAAAGERLQLFDMQGATARLASRRAACENIAVAYWYLRGLTAARDAYRYGGSPESLEPVKVAINELVSSTLQTRAAEIARIVLMAASAAAQSEREEMALLLDHAITLERQQRSAGSPGAPLLTAQEVSGDLWLQVHRFEDARRAYREASEQVGPTRRTTLGLARTAFRLGDLADACRQYRVLVDGWPAAEGEPAGLAEAQTFLRRPECAQSSTPKPRR